MYKGFNLKYDNDINTNNEYYSLGNRISSDYKKQIKNVLDDFLLSNGNLSGTKMQENWFPQINADVFISHSHADEEKAKMLAGWLSKNFKINAFIDSCIWGHSDILLKTIDDKFCFDSNRNVYIYEKRNSSTSHVHMMLSTALNMMIYNTECMFFMNTPNSITTENIITSTLSPWIYSEITMSKLTQRELSAFRSKEDKLLQKSADYHLIEAIEYELDLNNLTDLGERELKEWADSYTGKEYSLDILYKQTFNKNYLQG